MVSTKVLFAALVMGALLLPAPCARGAVDRIEISSRAPLAGGRAFGAVGPYEILTGRLHYAVDPGDPANQAVVDLDHAPRDATGRVAFALDERHAGARGDPRPSILERYPTRGRFLERTRAAIDGLVRRRLLLAEDEGAVLGRAGALYDALMDADAPRNCAFAVP